MYLFLFFIPKMERNKSKKLKEKKYLDRFIRLNVYSHMRDNRPYLKIKPEEMYLKVMHAVKMHRELTSQLCSII